MSRWRSTLIETRQGEVGGHKGLWRGNGMEITFEMWKNLFELESLHEDEFDSDFVR